tara:strand:+ start:351 stop:1256 length:906 start_codon:yes stop_codon:yes gene_type:complete
MALVSVNPLDEVKATDVNQFKDALEGAAAGTVDYFLRTSTGEDFLIRLGGNATTRKLSVQDSDAVEVFKVDADGNVTVAGTFNITGLVTALGNLHVTGTLTAGAIVAPASATPAQTVAASLVYNSTYKSLTVGTGSTRQHVGIPIFTNTTTRDASIAAPTEGLFAYTSDTDILWYYSGSAWLDREADLSLTKYSEKLISANSGTAYAIDTATGTVFHVTLTGNATLTFTNAVAAGRSTAFTLVLTQDATGSRTVVWGTTVKWGQSTPPTITTTAAATDVYTFFTIDGGTSWFGYTAGQVMA